MGNFAEGYIKFNCQINEGEFNFPDEEYSDLTRWRDRYYDLNMIGIYPNGIGFGNISVRHNLSEEFIISGSATGRLKHLEKQHYALVTEYNFRDNSLSCTGRLKASSESLSHAVIYQACPSVHGVIHIHHKPLWLKLLDQVPTTSPDVPYGTPEMAEEINHIIVHENLGKGGLIVMAGHEEGIISFGFDLDSAGSLILHEYEKMNIHYSA